MFCDHIEIYTHIRIFKNTRAVCCPCPQEPILALLGPETDPETRGRGFPNEVLITKKKSRVSSDKIIDQCVDAFSPNSVKVSQIKL